MQASNLITLYFDQQSQILQFEYNFAHTLGG